MSPRYLTVAGVAEYLSLSEDAVRMLVKREALTHIKVGRRLRFDIRDLDAWMREHRREAKAS